MRRQWYIGFGVILLCLFALFAMLQDIVWFFCLFDTYCNPVDL